MMMKMLIMISSGDASGLFFGWAAFDGFRHQKVLLGGLGF